MVTGTQEVNAAPTPTFLDVGGESVIPFDIDRVRLQ
jgi:hypothetical protein